MVKFTQAPSRITRNQSIKPCLPRANTTWSSTGAATTHDHRTETVDGGASAVCLIDALAQSGLEHGSITIFEPSEQLWRGRPYQPDMAAVRVNIAPEGMTVRFGDKNHFLRWLAAREETTEPAEPAVDYVDSLCGIPIGLGQLIKTMHADIVVNAVNPRARTMSPLSGSLIESLVAHDLGQWHPGGGVHVRSRHQPVPDQRSPGPSVVRTGRSGRRQPVLHLGHALAGRSCSRHRRGPAAQRDSRQAVVAGWRHAA